MVCEKKVKKQELYWPMGRRVKDKQEVYYEKMDQNQISTEFALERR